MSRSAWRSAGGSVRTRTGTFATTTSTTRLCGSPAVSSATCTWQGFRRSSILYSICPCISGSSTLPWRAVVRPRTLSRSWRPAVLRAPDHGARPCPARVARGVTLHQSTCDEVKTNFDSIRICRVARALMPVLTATKPPALLRVGQESRTMRLGRLESSALQFFIDERERLGAPSTDAVQFSSSAPG